MSERFSGTDQYVATEDLMMAVNAAPSTSELLDWIKLLVAEDIQPEALRSADSNRVIPILHGALLKNEQDVHLFEQLVFMHRRVR
jgi:MoxR-like ATPase